MSTAGSLYAIILLNALGHYLMAMQNTFLGRPDLAAAIRAAPLEGPLVSDNAFAIMANIQFDLVRSSSQLPFHGGRSYPSKTSCKGASSSVQLHLLPLLSAFLHGASFRRPLRFWAPGHGGRARPSHK